MMEDMDVDDVAGRLDALSGRLDELITSVRILVEKVNALSGGGG